jgi:hypothetical protein
MGMGPPCLWSGAVPLFAAAGRTAFASGSQYAFKLALCSNARKRDCATGPTTVQRDISVHSSLIQRAKFRILDQLGMQ